MVVKQAITLESATRKVNAMGGHTGLAYKLIVLDYEQIGMRHFTRARTD